MAGVSEVRVFPLTYADAVNTARLITELFQQEEDRASQRQPRGFGGRLMMMMGGGRRGRRSGGDQEQQGAALRQRVVAAADERTNTLVVSGRPESWITNVSPRTRFSPAK